MLTPDGKGVLEEKIDDDDTLEVLLAGSLVGDVAVEEVWLKVMGEVII